MLEKIKNIPEILQERRERKRNERIIKENLEEERKARRPIEDVKKETLDETESFISKYKVREIFGLTDDLFDAYFASYLVLKDYHELDAYLKSPEVHLGRRIPILSSIFNLFSAINDEILVAATELRSEAEEKAKGYPLDFSSTIQRAATLLSTIYVNSKDGVQDKMLTQEEMDTKIANYVQNILEKNPDFLPQNEHLKEAR